MEYKTEVGKVLHALGYREDTCEKLDNLIMFFTCIPISERRELLGSIIWHFDFKLDENTIKKLDRILAQVNQ